MGIEIANFPRPFSVKLFLKYLLLRKVTLCDKQALMSTVQRIGTQPVILLIVVGVSMSLT